jgi:hypothetical protein
MTVLPNVCVGIMESIARNCRSEKEREILRRLTTDPQMKSVWRELTKRNRTNGSFVYPARPRGDKPAVSPDEVQGQALSELFHLAYCSARDGRSTSTLDQAMDHRREIGVRVTTLRECAEMRRQDLIGAPQAVADADAVDRAAEWFEAISRDIRSIDDPLSVQRQRGDPLVNGVAATIGVWLFERFGKRFDETAATLASVALGKPANPRAVRSALARIK